jgi:hypothetical protein
MPTTLSEPDSYSPPARKKRTWSVSNFLTVNAEFEAFAASKAPLWEWAHHYPNDKKIQKEAKRRKALHDEKILGEEELNSKPTPLSGTTRTLPQHSPLLSHYSCCPTSPDTVSFTVCVGSHLSRLPLPPSQDVLGRHHGEDAKETWSERKHPCL